ncbi:DUF2971 domain-containing protein [Inediibacterium massiliense]|uniref:DUF2971 domain-containing protein n=1 Tax=Inediibacterium massiliense TaxID=1658111 RepID=UPI0006B5CBF2|nr:DUF2971 domain-containing protein [Inediibacterium massiliense]
MQSFYEHIIDDVLGKKIPKSNASSVFHFTSVPALYSMIKTHSLRLTNSMYLNDRNEFADFLHSMCDTVRNLIDTEKDEQTKNNYKILLEEYKKALEKNEQKRTDYYYHASYFIFSASEYDNSIPMWNYYSQNSGICIEFDLNLLRNFFEYCIKDCGESIFIDYKCIYEKQEKHNILKTYIIERINEIQPQFWKSALKYSYAFKDKIFKYERETRFVIRLDKKYFEEQCDFDKEEKQITKRLSLGFYNANDTIRPVIKLRGNKQLPIKRIIISPFNETETLYSGLKRFLDFHGYSNVIVDTVETSMRKDF